MARQNQNQPDFLKMEIDLLKNKSFCESIAKMHNQTLDEYYIDHIVQEKTKRHELEGTVEVLQKKVDSLEKKLEKESKPLEERVRDLEREMKQVHNALRDHASVVDMHRPLR